MKNKGITLVALVVTVIILLIIAGVAVSMITGNDGLFTKANEAGTLYNQKAQEEANLLQQLLDSEYFNGIAGSGSSTGNGGNQNPPAPSVSVANGSFNTSAKLNTPDTSKLPTATTKYVTYIESNGTYTPQESATIPNNWYDYVNGQWANIKTTSIDGTLEASWVWIPRFAYRLPENERNAKRIEVAFIKGNGKIGVLADGTEVQCYYSTETAITTGGTGLYKDATAFAKGIASGQEQAWIIHPAFTFGDTQLSGIWFAKFEASSSNPSATSGGGNVTTLKVQVKPSVSSWRNINLKNMFEVSKSIQDTGGALGTENGTLTIDTHLTKNMEWAAVSVLTLSRYGIYNPRSATGLTTNGGDGTLRVWNNPNTSYITGTVGTNVDAASVGNGSCTRYNTGNGPKGSTTGTVYGVYDMAGGAWDQVMGIMEDAVDSNIPANDSTGFTSSIWPNSKYYDIYAYGTSKIDYNRGKIGDFTSELSPIGTGATYSWHDDFGTFIDSSYNIFLRGGRCTDGTQEGVTAFARHTGVNSDNMSFRPVLVMP